MNFFDIFKNFKKSKLGGKRTDISVLFSDIRNFTSISDSIEPEEVSCILNEYFAEMIPIILKNKGTVNKFMGDAVMVIFGAPVEDPKHPERAVKCAIEMHEKSLELQSVRRRAADFPLQTGIGISSGIAFVGNIGSSEINEYSAIGHTVNIANRLETFNKLYKTNILISENTYERVKERVEVEEIDTVCITARSEPIKIYELKSVLKNE